MYRVRVTIDTAMTKVCFDRFESLIYAPANGISWVSVRERWSALAAIFVISSRIGDKNGLKKFEINRDLVSIFKKVTKK